MADNSLKISYKIYLEAEDISQSRISSTASYVSNLFKNCTNSYLQKAEVDNESDMDDLRFVCILTKGRGRSVQFTGMCRRFSGKYCRIFRRDRSSAFLSGYGGKFFNFLSWSRGCIPVPFRSRK